MIRRATATISITIIRRIRIHAFKVFSGVKEGRPAQSIIRVSGSTRSVSKTFERHPASLGGRPGEYGSGSMARRREGVV